MLKFVIAYAYLTSECGRVFAEHDWSFQARLTVDNRSHYGQSNFAIFGRGFMTAVSGYSAGYGEIFVHTTNNGIAVAGTNTWSLQARLKPSDFVDGDSFGEYFVADKHTILVASPMRSSGRGAVYVFNGTQQYWTQIQKLVVNNLDLGNNFGRRMALDGNRLLVGAEGTKGSYTLQGAAYVFERSGMFKTWSLTAKLLADSSLLAEGNMLGYRVALSQDTALIGALNDGQSGPHSGSVYVFQYNTSTSLWSQQQQLIAADIELAQPDRIQLTVGGYAGIKFFPYEIAIYGEYAAVGTARLDRPSTNEDMVYIYQWDPTSYQFSESQRLFQASNNSLETYNTARVSMSSNALLVTMQGPNSSSIYLFRNTGGGSSSWSQQQVITLRADQYDAAAIATYENSGFIGIPSNFPLSKSSSSFSNPEKAAFFSGGNYTLFGGGNFTASNYTGATMWGGNMVNGGTDGMVFHTRFTPTSCLLISMTDHFATGWGTALLTVVAPDTSNDSFAPSCNLSNPFYVRYCPYTPEDEGVYIVKVYDGAKAINHWELSWTVYVEATAETYRGDFSSKMMFFFNTTTKQFSYYQGQNLVSSTQPPCRRCYEVEQRTWAGLQIAGGSYFQNFEVHGGDYYIADLNRNMLVSGGMVCDKIVTYECYKMFADGIYQFRLGSGVFSSLMNDDSVSLPIAHARWSGCGVNGTNREQLIFEIGNGTCTPLQLFDFSTRCSVPPALGGYINETTVVMNIQATTIGDFF